MNIVYSNRPAERILFRELFRDIPTVQRNGGTLIGSPAVKDGVTLDGSTQYVTHDIDSDLFAHDEWSVVLECNPDFAAEDGNDYYLFDTDIGSRYYLLKTSTNRIFLVWADTTIASIAPGVWASHWRQGERNVIAISSSNGATDMWLNKSPILVADPSTWITKHPTQLFTGASFAGTFSLDGIIHSLSIHGCLLEQEDVNHL